MMESTMCEWCHGKPAVSHNTCSEECRLDLEYFTANPHLNPFRHKRPDKVLQKGETIEGGTVEQQIETMMTQIKNFDTLMEKLAWLQNFKNDPAYSEEAYNMVLSNLSKKEISK
jgi:hypothetical protein